MIFSPGLLLAQNYNVGDVFAGVGNGVIHRFDPSGTLLDILNTGSNSYDTGMAFDINGNLYATVFDGDNVIEFNNLGSSIGPFGSGYNTDDESIVFDLMGNAYVGQADGSHQVLKFSSSGAPLATYSPAVEDRGTDWIDLAADQCTLHYTSEGSSVKQFNVCTNTQGPDFATGLAAPCYAHRIRPNFEELVACATQVYRLNSSGGIIQTYLLPDSSFLFALNLDPDNKTFWTADYDGGTIYHVDIASGNLIKQFSGGPVSEALAGITVYGEITAAISAPPPTTSYYITTAKASTLNALGSQLAANEIATGTIQDTVVVLFFRTPTYKNGVYGVSAVGGIPLSTVAALVEDFAEGFYNALEDNSTAHVRIVIATNNGTTQCGGNQVTVGHGQAWADMVNTVASWVIDQGYAGQVDIAGGSDMELSSAVWGKNASCGAAGALQWASAADTRAWVGGYASVKPARFLYDVGDAGGCPPSGTCNAGWTQDDVWFVSWGSPPAEPLPEIYFNANALQWANLSRYGFTKYNQDVIMAGSLTEYAACLQNPTDPTCKPSPNTPTSGWLQLYRALNASPNTAQTLSWSTDVAWLTSH